MGTVARSLDRRRSFVTDRGQPRVALLSTWPGVLVAIAAGYALLSMAAYQLFGALTIGVTFFPPAGLTLAAFLLLPRRLWPSVAAGVVIGELTVDVIIQGQGVWWSLGWVAANLVEPFLGAWMIRRLAPAISFSRGFVLAMLAGGLLAGPACGAAIGATVLARSGPITFIDAFPDIWVGDALGVLVVAPLILVMARPDDFVFRRTRTVDMILVTVVTTAVTLVLVLADELPLGYAAIILLAVPAARYSAREVALAGAVVATVLTTATARGRGPWAMLSDGETHAELIQQQAFLLVALGSAWLLKLEVVERVKAVSAAKASEVELAAAREQARNERHLSAMHDVLADLAVAATTAEVLDVVDRHARPTFDAIATAVAIQNEAGNLTVLAATGGWADLGSGDTLDARSPDPLALAAWSGRLTIARDPGMLRPDDLAPSDEAQAGATGPVTHRLAAPLALSTKTGSIGLTRSGERPWTENAQIRAIAFASMIADALERTERYELEHSVALTLQHAILPRHLPSMEGTRIAARYLPASDALEVGGDWFDVIADDERRTLTVVIGDVAGHSLAAAAEMGNMASACRALAYAGHGPSALIDYLDTVANRTPEPTMTTMVCARIDVATRRVRYAVAGHPPPLVRAPDGAVTRLDGAGSPPLAIGLDLSRPEDELTLDHGASLLFYTDGLFERRDVDIDVRLRRLETTFGVTDSADADAACDTMVTAMIADASHEDDVALVYVTIS